MDTKTMTAKEAMGHAVVLAKAAQMGKIDYHEAKKQAQPYLDIVNAKGKEIAKKYNKRYQPVRFLGLAR